MRSMVEGASDETFHFPRRRIVEADAPSTALRAVPLPRLHGGGKRKPRKSRLQVPSFAHENQWPQIPWLASWLTL
jgi:hypothetical protein